MRIYTCHTGSRSTTYYRKYILKEQTELDKC